MLLPNEQIIFAIEIGSGCIALVLIGVVFAFLWVMA